jgi:two-component system response regulator
MNKPLEVLLIEDNPHDAELAIRALNELNLADHLTHLTDGQAALDFLFGTGTYEGRDVNQQPKVILLDLKLPKLNGIEVLRELRMDERMKYIPIVVLTSSREERDISEAYHLGANSYVVKPMDFLTYLDVIGNMGSYWLKINLLYSNV